ncbi:MAG: Bacterial antitoxin of type system, VapB, partial [Actinomycetota bacterium]
ARIPRACGTDVRYLQPRTYAVIGGMAVAKKHTSLYIDAELLADAERLLGTSGPTETVNTALREAADLVRRRNLLKTSFNITEEELRQMRHETGPFAEDE